MTVLNRRDMLKASLSAALFAGVRTMAREEKSGHLVLLGDSIFDNKVYVRNDPAVIDQVRKTLPEGWKGTLLAVDGSVTSDISRQVGQIPKTASHLVMSIGGNNALRQQAMLKQSVTTVGEALHTLGELREAFAVEYAAALAGVLEMKKPTILCTIYDPNFPKATRQRAAVAALSVFNDVITRAAVAHGLPVMDLRVVISESGDYANPIEPSAQGGQKMANLMRRILTEHDFSARQCCFYC